MYDLTRMKKGNSSRSTQMFFQWMERARTAIIHDVDVTQIKSHQKQNASIVEFRAETTQGTTVVRLYSHCTKGLLQPYGRQSLQTCNSPLIVLKSRPLIVLYMDMYCTVPFVGIPTNPTVLYCRHRGGGTHRR